MSNDFDPAYRGICSRRAEEADRHAKLMHHFTQVILATERILDATSDELKEARDRGRQCQLGRDELERENQSLRHRLSRIDQENTEVIRLLEVALNSIPEDDEDILDIPDAREHIEHAMKIIAPPVDTGWQPF